MSRENKTRYAVLGMLAIKAGSGYDIKKFMEQSTNHFWREGDNSIYPVLKKLLEEGLIKLKNNEPISNRKTIYVITEQGKSELRAWLEEEPVLFQNRNELLLKIFYGSQVKKEIIIKYVKNFRHRISTKLENLQKIEKKVILKNLSQSELFQYMTLRAGILHYETNITWCDEVLNILMKYVDDKNL